MTKRLFKILKPVKDISNITTTTINYDDTNLTIPPKVMSLPLSTNYDDDFKIAFAMIGTVIVMFLVFFWCVKFLFKRRQRIRDAINVLIGIKYGDEEELHGSTDDNNTRNIATMVEREVEGSYISSLRMMPLPRSQGICVNDGKEPRISSSSSTKQPKQNDIEDDDNEEEREDPYAKLKFAQR